MQLLNGLQMVISLLRLSWSLGIKVIIVHSSFIACDN